jgi:hypothetical protein
MKEEGKGKKEELTINNEQLCRVTRAYGKVRRIRQQTERNLRNQCNQWTIVNLILKGRSYEYGKHYD